VNTVEERLRDAYRAAAETVRPETVLADGIRGLHDGDLRPARRLRRILTHGRLLIPLAAAAAVAALAIATSVLVPRSAPGRGGPSQDTAAGRGTPAFFVALNWSLRPSMIVVNATTGTHETTVRLPFRATELTGVATGDGRTFVAAARTTACRTSLYRFSVSAQGRPTALTRFGSVPGVIGTPWDMALARDGRTIAYATLACGQAPGSRARDQPEKGYLAVVNTVTGQTRRWTYTGRPVQTVLGTGDVSLSADGRVVAFADRVLRTDAAPGSLERRGRVVMHSGEFGSSDILGGVEVAPDGKTVYFGTFRVRHDKPIWSGWKLRAFDLATGQASLVRSLPGTQGTPAAVSADPTGRFLMIEYATRHGTRLARLDIATGRLTPLNAPWVVDAAIAW
jgi:Lactonase, 7-bladed beta-propeller